MKEITVAIIGSGSTYCPELIDGFIRAKDSLRLRRVAFMDIDERKRTVVGGLCVRMLQKAGIACETVLTDDLDEALQGADFVVTQIRVGKLPARHLDETIPLKYDLIGQETTGIGGFFKALRTVPVMKHIAERMAVICPDAWLINFANPSGIIAEYLANFTSIKSVGLCNVPINMLDNVKAAVGEGAEITYLGLNHLSWIGSVRLNGEEVLEQMFRPGFAPAVMNNIHNDGFDADFCLHAVHGFPSSYLQYFYSRDKKLAHLKAEKKSRAQVCMEIEEELLELYSQEELNTKPALLDRRGGHKYSLAAVSLIDSIANDKRDVHVVNIPNNGTLPFMAADDVVEIAAVVGKDGFTPVPVRPEACSRHMQAMMQTVKAYEKLTVQAALHGDDAAALNALTLHPLVGDFHRARACYEEMKEAHRAYLPQFYADNS
ncbi:MAG: 6-phospho-beta-glucosidase [Clostridia bacterium]|nr:6-phospho-beta-glucosidase [Clostridia bacterium]